MKEIIVEDKPIMNIKYGEQSYALRGPTYSEVKQLKNIEADGGDHEEAMFSLLEKCGLPNDVADKFPVQALNEVLEHFTERLAGKKK